MRQKRVHLHLSDNVPTLRKGTYNGTQALRKAEKASS